MENIKWKKKLYCRSSLEDLHDFYKNINFDKNIQNINEPTETEINENEYLNMPITIQEIEKVCKN